jgi:hypothetical protein
MEMTNRGMRIKKIITRDKGISREEIEGKDGGGRGN